jgi:hypothetical protein
MYTKLYQTQTMLLGRPTCTPEENVDVKLYMQQDSEQYRSLLTLLMNLHAANEKRGFFTARVSITTFLLCWASLVIYVLRIFNDVQRYVLQLLCKAMSVFLILYRQEPKEFSTVKMDKVNYRTLWGCLCKSHTASHPRRHYSSKSPSAECQI